MTRFVSVRNEQVAELVSRTDEQVVLKMEGGKEKSISPATLKRWWKEIEEPQTEEITPTDEVVAEETDLQQIADENSSGPLQIGEIMEITEEIMDHSDLDDEEEQTIEAYAEHDEQVVAEVAKEVKKPAKKEKKKRELISGEHELKNVVEGIATDMQTEIFEASVKSFRSLKVEGRMYMAFTFNKKGITLWMRSAAIEGMTEYKKMNHMFDARVKFEELNDANVAEIKKLMKASYDFQVAKLEAGKNK